MAFIDGWITRWECPICGLGCKPKLIQEKFASHFAYYHAEAAIRFVNGYPTVCENSGKMLTENEINLVHEPNIKRIPGTFA